MHIGFDISQTGSHKAGCGFFAHSMLQALFNQAPQYKYSLFPSFGDFYFDARMPLSNPYSRGKYGPRHLTREFAGMFWNSPHLERQLKQPDIIHANNFWCPAPLKHTRLIYTLHDLAFLVNPAWTTETNRVGCFSGVFRASVAADWIMATSEATKSHFLTVFPHYPQERVRVIYQCSRFTERDLHRLGKQPKAIQGITAGQFWLSVGTLEPRKNQRQLVDAYMSYLKQNGPKLPLIIAGGKGWLMEHFQQELKALQLDTQVILTGYVTDDELIWLYRNCYAHLYPSHFEGFGLPVLEGMQFSAATLTSNTSSLPEVAGNAAVLLPPDNPEAWAQAMLHLAYHPAEKIQWSLAAQEQAQQFSWERSSQALLSLYEEAQGASKLF